MILNGSAAKIFGILIIGVFLSACGGDDVGPSAEKIQLDWQDKMDIVFKGIVNTEIRIDSKNILSEDRVEYRVSMMSKIKDNAINNYISSAERSAKTFGAIGGINMEPVYAARKVHGKKEKGILLYQLVSTGVWQLVRVTGDST